VETFRFAAVGRVIVYAGTMLQPSAKEWTDYMSSCAEHARKYPSDACSLISSLGVGPNAAQRKQANEVTPTTTRVAILMDGLLGRGIVTAMAWFVPSTTVFGFREMEKAAVFLQLSDSERAPVFAQLAKFRSDRQFLPRK
jgi:hypothetical protein